MHLLPLSAARDHNRTRSLSAGNGRFRESRHPGNHNLSVSIALHPPATDQHSPSDIFSELSIQRARDGRSSFGS